MSRARDLRRRYPPAVRERLRARAWRDAKTVVRRAFRHFPPGGTEFTTDTTEEMQGAGVNRFGRALHFLTFPTICKWRAEAEGRTTRDLRIPIGPPSDSRLFGAARAGGKNVTLTTAVLNGEWPSP